MSKTRALFVTLSLGYVLYLHLAPIFGLSFEGVKIKDIPGIVRSIPYRIQSIPSTAPIFWSFVVNYSGITMMVIGFSMLLLHYYGLPSGIVCFLGQCDHQHGR